MPDRDELLEPVARTRSDVATLPGALRAAVSARGGATAVVDGPTRLTYAQLAGEVHDVGRALVARGVEAGDRVALWAPNSAGWVVAALAIAEVGATLVPLNTRYTGVEARDILRRARVRLLVVAADFLDLDFVGMLDDSLPFDDEAPDGGDVVEGLPDLATIVRLPGGRRGGDGQRRSAAVVGWHDFLRTGAAIERREVEDRAAAVTANDIADIVFTSGTTGRSKGVLTTHAQTIACAEAWASCATVDDRDRYLIASPFAHTFGYKAGLVVCLLRRATMYPLPVFDVEEAARLLGDEAITVVPGPPTILQGLADRLRSEDGPTSWRVAVTGSATVPVSLVERLEQELHVDTVLTAYGLTEAVVVTMCSPADPPEIVARTAGRPVAGFEVRVRRDDGSVCDAGEQGEIELRGPNLMLGYLDDPAATAAVVDADGWFRTGDAGVLDGEGYLSITDRIKNMFTVGGFNVYPAEVERVLGRLEGVVECAVVGVADERLGSVGRAFVVRADGVPLRADDVLAHCAARLANFKVPRSVVFLDRLPRSFAGKVVLQDLHDLSEAPGAGAEH